MVNFSDNSQQGGKIIFGFNEANIFLRLFGTKKAIAIERLSKTENYSIPDRYIVRRG